MPLTGRFYDAVKGNNVRGVRIMMKNSLLADPTFEEFAEMESDSRAMPGLYDQHDGKELISDRSQWNEEYMNSQMVQVVNNFSHERLDHLKSVVRYLRPVTKKSTAAPHDSSRTRSANRQPSFMEQMERDKAEGRIRDTVQGAAIGAVVGGVVGSAVAAVASSVVMAGATIGFVAGAVVGGVIGSASGNKGE